MIMAGTAVINATVYLIDNDSLPHERDIINKCIILNERYVHVNTRYQLSG